MQSGVAVQRQQQVMTYYSANCDNLGFAEEHHGYMEYVTTNQAEMVYQEFVIKYYELLFLCCKKFYHLFAKLILSKQVN